jgi:hypothetical protein
VVDRVGPDNLMKKRLSGGLNASGLNTVPVLVTELRLELLLGEQKNSSP